ncbi:sulfurtransferase TusA family protein [Thalassobaculum salexigens]|uniref:sulfurtransferase TusA family protein n=1 Tax=Thalassobaculum salexigens TaxID=455360 RepID=UPI00248EC4AA|nr:sulfurtransferase TusA family protein [Thalassobaculum salexigens]
MSADQPTPDAPGSETAEPIARSLDVRGLKCPLPVLKARKAITQVEIGALLEVLVTDPAAMLDFRHYARQSGHELVSAEEGEVLRFVLRRTA